MTKEHFKKWYLAPLILFFSCILFSGLWVYVNPDYIIKHKPTKEDTMRATFYKRHPEYLIEPQVSTTSYSLPYKVDKTPMGNIPIGTIDSGTVEFMGNSGITSVGVRAGPVNSIDSGINLIGTMQAIKLKKKNRCWKERDSIRVHPCTPPPVDWRNFSALRGTTTFIPITNWNNRVYVWGRNKTTITDMTMDNSILDTSKPISLNHWAKSETFEPVYIMVSADDSAGFSVPFIRPGFLVIYQTYHFHIKDNTDPTGDTWVSGYRTDSSKFVLEDFSDLPPNWSVWNHHKREQH